MSTRLIVQAHNTGAHRSKQVTRYEETEVQSNIRRNRAARRQLQRQAEEEAHSKSNRARRQQQRQTESGAHSHIKRILSSYF